MPWKKSEKKRLGGLSSFGFEGVNVHAVITEAPEVVARAIENTLHHSPQLITLSAQSNAALKELTRSYVAYLKTHSTIELCDIAYTTTCRRAHHDQRLAIIASSVSDLCEKLNAYLDEKTHPLVFQGRKNTQRYQDTENTLALENSETNLALLAKSYSEGAQIDWKELHKNYQHRLVELPTYAWQRKHYWIETDTSYHTNHTPTEDIYLSDKMFADTTTSNPLRQQLQSLDHHERKKILIAHIRAQLPNLDNYEWQLSDSFFDMGMNSLAMVELRLRLQTALNTDLPTTLLYTHPTLEELTDYLLENIEEGAHGH